jgi:predicted TPR repeat methyltransferase
MGHYDLLDRLARLAWKGEGIAMEPSQVGSRYDRIAQRWQDNTPDRYGMEALERAIRLVKDRKRSLDVGCGSTGRFIRKMQEHGFTADGLDVSAEMIALSQQRNPEARLFVADICEWTPLESYDLITAWDSIFHLPLEAHEPVIRKLCAAVNEGVILMFTFGGGDQGEISGTFWGEDFDYSTLGTTEFVRLLRECGCQLLHLEYDQWPENHVHLIARKM